MSKEKVISRRKFLKMSGAAAGVVAVAGVVGGSIAEAATPHHAGSADKAAQKGGQLRAKIFFTDSDEFETLAHATERIFPKDKMGPGAIDLAVPYFIDNQLAGAYGFNAREYQDGPFYPGTPQQTYQTPLNRGDVFHQGLAALNRESQTKFKKVFTALTDAQKDEILTSFEKGAATVIETVPSSYFFTLLRYMTLAGVYADPIYNGNNNMGGWLMKQYPGAQMSYLDIIMDKKFKNIEPVSLASMQ